ncbi:amine oxidase, partial [Fistulina hepatica ATCC 64428]
GLIAAYNLTQSGKTVQVVEARDRIGGRSYTDLSLGIPVELGCMAIHGYSQGNPIKQYAARLGLVTHTRMLAFPPSNGTVYTATGALDKALVAKLQSNLSAALARLSIVASEAAQDTLSAADVLIAPSSQLFDGLSENDRPVAVAVARSLEIGWGIRLEDAAAVWIDWASTIAYVGTDGMVVGGCIKLVDALRNAAEQTGKAKFTLGARVAGVKRTADGVDLTTTDGTHFSASAALCTIPLGPLKGLKDDFFDPPLPPRKKRAIQRTSVGVLEKLGLSYDSLWWDPAAGPFTFLLERGTLLVFPISTSPPTLHALIPHGMTGMSADEVHLAIAKALAPGKDVPKPVHVLSSSWAKDELALGTTSSPVKVGDGRTPLDWAEAARPVWGGRLGFAGEATEIDHRGSVTGAVLSGEREAVRIKALLETQ